MPSPALCRLVLRAVERKLHTTAYALTDKTSGPGKFGRQSRENIESSYMGLHPNPFIAFYRRQPHESLEKRTTGLTGLHVSEAPHTELKRLYARILRTVEQMPETSAYRKATAQLVKHRMQIVESNEKITDVEEKIGMGQAEELIWQARNELACARAMLHYRVWEPLIEKAPEDQWRWPV